MSEVNVELVKYDTKKTKKRKRANLVVAAKTEAAVIEKLEMIHKGDQVETIHEIVWGEEKKEPQRDVSRGAVKFYNDEKGFGFIESDTDEEDFFFHSTALNGEKLYDNDLVEFEKSVGPKGPIAIHIKLIKE